MNSKDVEALKKRINQQMIDVSGFDIPDIEEAKTKQDVLDKATAFRVWYWAHSGEVERAIEKVIEENFKI